MFESVSEWKNNPLYKELIEDGKKDHNIADWITALSVGSRYYEEVPKKYMPMVVKYFDLWKHHCPWVTLENGELKKWQ